MTNATPWRSRASSSTRAQTSTPSTLGGRTPLQLALLNAEGVLAVAAVLLVAGANANAADNQGETPLHAAARTSADIAALELLLECGADVRVVDRKGRTPLHFAAGAGAKGTRHVPSSLGVDALLEKGADAGAADADGWQPLHHLANYEVPKECGEEEADEITFGCAEAAELLVERGVDVNAATPNGETPLMLATRARNFDVVDTLLELGARIRPPACAVCADTAAQRAGLQALAVGAAAEVKRLEVERASLARERKHLAREREVLTRERWAAEAARAAAVAATGAAAARAAGAAGVRQVAGGRTSRDDGGSGSDGGDDSSGGTKRRLRGTAGKATPNKPRGS